MTTISAPEKLETISGVTLQIRPATQFDEKELVALFKKVSEADRRFRFLSGDTRIEHHRVEPLIQVDHDRCESYLAFETTGGQLVATGQLACDDAFDTAEVAVAVRSDFRGRGIGWSLLDKLAREACRRGVKRVISIEDRANHAAITLEKETGFTAEPIEGDPSLVLLTKTCDCPA
ncbi:GNAT family N-acetyltransferase [Novosphingobium aquimarinum]|uniref:GNAT family N-acetyltransferase n=1 Tax=Novosphingobium aquimarinum TaxID=2682494 RepID=UPI0012EB668E|nr:GNAT family N-acetyltransferase [Novosphingobium aquimarinum]